MCSSTVTTQDNEGSLYAVLGVSMKATPDEIRLSYLRLARMWHPDRRAGDITAMRKFQQIQCAYEVLSNAKRRAHYDLQWLDLLDVEDYLERFQEFILTANGLGLAVGEMALCSEHGIGPLAEGTAGRPTPIKAA
ncbi:hypothetical protein HYH03_002678 [Edaphochlamys debaryana]|uniref:J domain-containing protein n=1 Tax=Edaphochlamys debaryana TaxID=47281 RepID=A0A835YJJ6_9CHLO|nr:hypothetical protein HYH03_002678 [Edaphochlamys debaryana]|eukprot:KAG2499745.1 hypothetical protein HYH03_002678 [Edaphochlamys debaryana]